MADLAKNLAGDDRDFLTGDGIRKAIQELVGAGGEVCAAVAYWGKGGAGHTGLTRRKRSERDNIRILCDLNSGACNPSEIRRLQTHGFEVRTLDRLHAKVWIGDSSVIVGSANASTSGLADEHRLGTNVEAALVVRDPELAQALRVWFDDEWWGEATESVDEPGLQAAEEVWRRRRRLGRVRPVRKRPARKRANPVPDERDRLGQKLVWKVADAAAELWQADDRPDITLRAIRRCQADPEWRRDYRTYVGAGTAEEAARKRKINHLFGRRVRERIGAGRVKRGVPAGAGDVVASYSALYRGG